MSSILVKGDISGIQEFIFNIQSKGSAKALKARSFFIQAIGWLAEERFKMYFPVYERIYNGGGNFYLKLKSENFSEDKFKKLQKEIVSSLPQLNLSLSIVFVSFEENEAYADILNKVNDQSNRVKLSRYKIKNTGMDKEEVYGFFDSFEDRDKRKDGEVAEVGRIQEEFRKFTSALARNPYYAIGRENSDAGGLFISNDSITLFGQKLTLTDKQATGNNKIYKHIQLIGDLPKDYKDIALDRRKEELRKEGNIDKSVTEFEDFGDFAKVRTGTDKIGVLKLDVDNLGSLFQTLRNEKDNKKLSELLEIFFTSRLSELLDSTFESTTRKTINGKEIQKDEKIEFKEQIKGRYETKKDEVKIFEEERVSHKFRNNLYVLFAGGDDCFIIGAWDAVVEFSISLKYKFDEFLKLDIRNNIPSLKGNVTLSASIMLVDVNFPVIKFADLAEEALHKAKTHKTESISDASGKPMKNKVNFLGYVFTWEEFAQMKEVKNKMQQMIVKYGESKAFLQRIIESFENTDTWYWRQKGIPFDPALLWRFLFHYRDIRHKPYFKAKFYEYFFGFISADEIGGIYKKYLTEAFSKNKGNTNTLPVAARWTEFLTRKKD